MPRSRLDQAPVRGRKFAKWGVAERYRALRARYAELEAKRALETAKSMPNAAVLQRLSRRTRLIKEELTAIECLLKAIGARFEDVLGRSSGGARPPRGQVAAQPA